MSWGLAAVRLGGKWGFVDKAGQEVVPCRYDEVRDFEYGGPMAAVQLGGKWGFVDEEGQEVVPCRYDEVRDFDMRAWLRCSGEASGAL